MAGAVDEVREALARTDPLRARLLSELDDHAATPHELADEVGAAATAVARQLERLERLGCVAVATERRESGHVDRVYARRQPEATWLSPLARIVGRLDHAGPATVVDRLALVGAALQDALDAAAWSVSFVSDDEPVLRTVCGVESRLDHGSGQRVFAAADQDGYELDAYPQTRRALRCRDGFVALRDAPDHDQAERAVLAALDYRGVAAAAARDRAGGYLLELYADRRTPKRFLAALPLVRVLTTQAASARASAVLG